LVLARATRPAGSLRCFGHVKSALPSAEEESLSSTKLRVSAPGGRLGQKNLYAILTTEWLSCFYLQIPEESATTQAPLATVLAHLSFLQKPEMQAFLNPGILDDPQNKQGNPHLRGQTN
jgi:hypothetical protein